MNSYKTRVARLEDVAGAGQSMWLVGIKGDPESEERYQEYLKSNIQKPFIWLDGPGLRGAAESRGKPSS